MRQPTRRTHGRLPTPRSQRGTMLIVALIVMVAMTLAGIATMRSVDTATVMAGNIAFRQSALAAADQGIQAGFDLLKSTKLPPYFNRNLNRDGMGQSIAGYYSNASVAEPDWSDEAAWSRATRLNGGTADAAGNVVWYIIERMCGLADCAPGDTCGGFVNLCGLTPSQAPPAGREGDENFRPGETFSAPVVHYRITARAVGPRNSIAIIQTLTR